MIIILHTLLLFCLIFTGCVENTTVSNPDKDFSYFKTNLENDLDFTSALETVVEIDNFIEDSLTKINSGVDLSQLKQSLSSSKHKSTKPRLYQH